MITIAIIEAIDTRSCNDKFDNLNGKTTLQTW